MGSGWIRALAVIGLVTLQPWIADWLPDWSAFGFPWPDFALLILVPLLLVPLSAVEDEAEDAGTDEP